ncbi:MAG: hypothetical protein N4A33_04480 [Bacteriovoracaceae bacterium]|jgi:hypothetical protein|nr:hypothetical protein [Bacteriovoracaceae bacterium]
MKKLLIGLLALGSISGFAIEECKELELDIVTSIKMKEVGGLKKILKGEPNITKEKVRFDICADVLHVFNYETSETNITALRVNSSNIEISAFDYKKVSNKLCSMFSKNPADRVETLTKTSSMKALQIAGKKSGRFYERKEKGFNSHTSILKRRIRVIDTVRCINL